MFQKYYAILNEHCIYLFQNVTDKEYSKAVGLRKTTVSRLNYEQSNGFNCIRLGQHVLGF